MNENLASRLYDPVEESTKLVVNELRDVFKVVPPVSFNDLQDDNAQCAAVIEPLQRRAGKVAAGTLIGQLVDRLLHTIEVFLPIHQLALSNDSTEQLIACERSGTSSRVRKPHRSVEFI